MIKYLLNLFSNKSKAFYIITGIVLVMVLGIIDHFTGYEVSFSIFYLLPIIFVSWFVNKEFGIAISGLSALVWLTADLFSGHAYSGYVIPIWNTIMRLGFFLIINNLLVLVKNLLDVERNISRTDFLTKMANTRKFYEAAENEINAARISKDPITVAYIDVDNFKNINDNMGHSEGDKLLSVIAEIIRNNTREIDVVARIGGDEFAVLMPKINDKQSVAIVDRIRSSLSKIVKENNWAVTISIGVVTFNNPDYKVDRMIKEADDLMYSAKKSGKDTAKYKVL